MLTMLDFCLEHETWLEFCLQLATAQGNLISTGSSTKSSVVRRLTAHLLANTELY